MILNFGKIIIEFTKDYDEFEFGYGCITNYEGTIFGYEVYTHQLVRHKQWVDKWLYHLTISFLQSFFYLKRFKARLIFNINEWKNSKLKKWFKKI